MNKQYQPSLSLPARFVSEEHFRNWEELNVRYWQDRVKRNLKTTLVNAKLNRWHAENPHPHCAGVPRESVVIGPWTGSGLARPQAIELVLPAMLRRQAE